MSDLELARIAERAARAAATAVEPEPEADVTWLFASPDRSDNALYGLPLHAVSVAAAVDGEVVAGAVADVDRGEVFTAWAGGGAWCAGRRLEVSACSELGQAMVATGFSSDAPMRGAQGGVLHHLVAQARDVRCFGSTALELCWVACGRVDAYYQHETEISGRAAGALIAAEAGAVVELPCPENDDLVLASTPGVYEALSSALRAASLTDRHASKSGSASNPSR